MKFGQSPCTIVQGLWPDFRATFKIHKKSNFDPNQIKISRKPKTIKHWLTKNTLQLICSQILYGGITSKGNEGDASIR